jgi:hypothetical protein
MREDALTRRFRLLKTEAANEHAAIIDRIEPGVVKAGHLLETHSFVQSIAISLKRIADTLQIIETQI